MQTYLLLCLANSSQSEDIHFVITKQRKEENYRLTLNRAELHNFVFFLFKLTFKAVAD